LQKSIDTNFCFGMLHKPRSTKTKNMELTQEYFEKVLDEKLAKFEAKIDDRFKEFETRVNQRFLDLELSLKKELDTKFIQFQIQSISHITSKVDQRLLDFEIRLERKFDEKLGKRLAEQSIELTKQLTEAYENFTKEGIEAQQVWVTEHFVKKSDLK